MCKIPIALFIAMSMMSFVIATQAEARAVRGCWASLNAYDAGVFYPPQPISYSVWYYALYEPFCAGKPKGACDWEVRCDPYQLGLCRR
jgi:hypothetical protein